MLGVRILPQKHELLAGYLLRLADVNGLTSIKHLMKIISVDKIKAINVVKWAGLELEIILPKLAIALNVADEEIIQRLTYSTPPFAYDPYRTICTDIRITQPRFCIECIKEGGVIDCRTALPLFSSCSKHNRAFLNHCPECGACFDWNTKVFDGCTKCGLMWADYVDNDFCIASELEKMLWCEVIESKEDTAQKVIDIVETIFAMARPYDLFPDRFYTFPICRILNKHISNAYSVLENQILYEQWIEACYQKRCTLFTIKNAVIAPTIELKNRLHYFILGENQVFDVKDNAITAKPFTLIESHEFIRSSRFKTLSCAEDTSAMYHVTRRQLEKYLGFKEDDLLCSIQFKILKAVNGSAIARDQIFNLDTLLTQIITPCSDASLSLINLDEYSKKMRMHLCSRGMLINDILLNEVDGEIILGNKPAQIYVEESSFNEWLSKKFSLTCQDNVTLQKAAKALCCGPNLIKSLVTSGTLQYPAWSRSTNEISGKSLKAYWFKHHRITEIEKVMKLT